MPRTDADIKATKRATIVIAKADAYVSAIALLSSEVRKAALAKPRSLTSSEVYRRECSDALDLARAALNDYFARQSKLHPVSHRLDDPELARLQSAVAKAAASAGDNDILIFEAHQFCSGVYVSRCS